MFLWERIRLFLKDKTFALYCWFWKLKLVTNIWDYSSNQCMNGLLMCAKSYLKNNIEFGKSVWGTVVVIISAENGVKQYFHTETNVLLTNLNWDNISCLNLWCIQNLVRRSAQLELQPFDKKVTNNLTVQYFWQDS